MKLCVEVESGKKKWRSSDIMLYILLHIGSSAFLLYVYYNAFRPYLKHMYYIQLFKDCGLKNLFDRDKKSVPILSTQKYYIWKRTDSRRVAEQVNVFIKFLFLFVISGLR